MQTNAQAVLWLDNELLGYVHAINKGKKTGGERGRERKIY